MPGWLNLGVLANQATATDTDYANIGHQLAYPWCQ